MMDANITTLTFVGVFVYSMFAELSASSLSESGDSMVVYYSIILFILVGSIFNILLILPIRIKLSKLISKTNMIFYKYTNGFYAKKYSDDDGFDIIVDINEKLGRHDDNANYKGKYSIYAELGFGYFWYSNNGTKNNKIYSPRQIIASINKLTYLIFLLLMLIIVMRIAYIVQPYSELYWLVLWIITGVLVIGLIYIYYKQKFYINLG
jgi:hypothetical protein